MLGDLYLADGSREDPPQSTPPLLLIIGQCLADRGIDLIAPEKRSRRRKVQDGRKLRRYRRRWKMERTFAWLGNYRRLVIRYENKLQVYNAFFHLACIMIVLRIMLTWF